ncbi:MAG TPA: hypothetical protein VK846_05410, partial [Candidatus Limnocylindria bacterium]|nr:hypothetical protein [Candidatus Limnocylindria bacterium]
MSGYLTGTTTWYRTNIYLLNGMVFVRSNGVLNIEAGTVIKGHNIGADSTNISALVVCRGAKIFAEGTPQNPIIFTAEADDTTFPDDLPIWGSTARGLWGGVVILGRCVLNSAIDTGGNAATPKYEVYEGLPDVIASGNEALLRFGGTDDNDNSGVLRYVSIRHGGAALFPNKEINGLSMGGVGRGTTIEFVEAYCVADDGFEFFGGTVNTRYLVSSFNDDDAFDTDMGYRGTNQFWFAIQAPDKRNYGMELNNQVNEVQAATQLTPAADFKVYNMTLIGAGALNPVGGGGGGNNAAIALRPWVGPKIYNSIFTDFNERGVLLDSAQGIVATQAVTGGFAQLHNTLWWDFVTGSGSGNIDNTATNLGRFTVATNYWTDLSLTNQIANPLLISISRTNVGAALDPRPAAGSPALNDYAATPGGGFLTPTTYRGAFGPNDLWIANWTALAEYGIIAPAAQNTVPVSGYLTGTTTWYRTNIYLLNGMVFVRSNGV